MTDTINRAITLLRHIANEGAGGARLVDLSRRAGLPHSTTRRILKSLIRERMVIQSEATRRYRLGHLTHEIGLASPNYYADLIDVCRPYLHRLVTETADNAFLLTKSGYEALCLDRIEGKHLIKTVVLRVGGRRPLGVGPAGLALLADMDDSEFRVFLQHQRATLTDFRAKETQLRRLIDETREKGYASGGEWADSGLDGVGVAFSTPNKVRTAVSIIGLKERMDPERISYIASLVKHAAKELEQTFR